jgi:hypothetical protein
MKLFARKALETRGVIRAAGIFFVMLLIPCGPLALGNGGGKTKTKAKASPTPNGSPGGSPAASPTPKFNVPIPPGHPAQGVRLPYFDVRGKLQMFFTIQKAYRIDMDHLEMKNAYMQTYDDKENLDATVFLTHSILDLNTRIVTSEVPVTVRRSDFTIVGQKMVFDTQKRVGRMTGHVRMTIYNRSSMSSSSPTPAAPGGAKPGPSITPKP